MPNLLIQGSQLSYEEKDILTFPEGLLGLPQLKRMVLVKQASLEPFMWLASLDEESVAFVVVDAHVLFPDYSPALPAEAHLDEILVAGEEPLWLAIVLVAAQWQETTVNLRAPLVVSGSSMRAAQLVLHGDKYQVAMALPF